MAINITCPGCHVRFKVSDKFAGQKGPCPKCKTQIQIPKKSEEVVIHTPAEFQGVTDAKGRSVLKPIARKYPKITPVMIAAVAGSAVFVVLFSLALRFMCDPATGAPMAILGLGSLVLGPPLALAGYTLLRDDEL